MKKLKNRLVDFFYTYGPDDEIDVLYLLLILLLVLLLCCTATSCVSSVKVDSFFKENKTETGKVVNYLYEEESNYTTIRTMHVGESLVPITTTHTTPEAFLVELECETPEGVMYLAKYEINKEDYEKHKPGDLIDIKENWKPLEYIIVT